MSAPDIYVKSLRLTQYRSYEALDLTFGPEPVVFFGPNGAGKTNILEAVSLLSPGRGLRRATLSDIPHIRGGEPADSWGVSAKIETPDDEIVIGTGAAPGAPTRRIVKIDDKASSALDLTDHLTLLWLTPAQDGLFTGGASDRRGFLDRFAMAHRPAHGRASLDYEKARRDRNRLLSDEVRDEAWYDALETKMAETGAKIARGRVETLDRLAREIADAPDSVFPKADIAVEGIWETLARDFDDVSLEDTIRDELRAARPLDMRAGRTRDGVHRSDLVTHHAVKQMPAASCSTGEQKALLTGLIMAQARSLKARSPLLLLDEVGAHLDPHRRAALIEDILDLNMQVWMTGTDAYLFEAFDGRAQMFEVGGGAVKPLT